MSGERADAIARAREVLGDDAESMTDDQVAELLAQADAIARGIVEAYVESVT